MTENRTKWTESRRESGGKRIEIAEIGFGRKFGDFAGKVE